MWYNTFLYVHDTRTCMRSAYAVESVVAILVTEKGTTIPTSRGVLIFTARWNECAARYRYGILWMERVRRPIELSYLF